MLAIHLQWNVSDKFVNKGERSLSFKHRLGHHANTLSSDMIIPMPKKINKAWKQELTKKLLKKFPGGACRVHAGHDLFEIHTSNPQTFVNNLANLILRSRHQTKDKFGTATKQSILNSVK